MDLHLAVKKAVVTGGGGAICGAIAQALAAEGAQVALWDLSLESATRAKKEIEGSGGTAIAVRCDVTKRESVRDALKETLEAFGTVDLLVNGAGGSRKETTTSADLEFFDLGIEDMKGVLSLNYLGTVIVSQEVGRIFAAKKSGVILNITSIAGVKPLTRSLTYSDGKAAANSFTQWLAVHMARTYSTDIRVNAVAPGFILTAQNRFILVDEKTGSFTERTTQILRQVPLARLGQPDEIVGAALWLLSDQARFVTGAVIPVDGGFTADSGV